MKRSQRWNTLQICPRRDSNTGGDALWSNTLPLYHGCVCVCVCVCVTERESDRESDRESPRSLPHACGNYVGLSVSECSLFSLHVGQSCDIWPWDNFINTHSLSSSCRSSSNNNNNNNNNNSNSSSNTTYLFNYISIHLSIYLSNYLSIHTHRRNKQQ